MSTVTLNGRTIDRNIDFTAMKNGELNWLLGSDGAPKYSDGQMKSKTKFQLADELRGIVNDIPEEKPRAEGRGVGRGHARPPSVSKTKAVAQSKKCNLIKALTAGKTTPEHVRVVLSVDSVLAEYWKSAEADIEKALAGIRPKSATKPVETAVTEQPVEA